jgi:hypothetical protein
MKRKLFFFGLISALLVMFLAGCPNPTNDPGDNGVDKTALATAILKAEAERQDVVKDTDAANVPLGTRWVTEAVWNTFDTAIVSAKSVNGNSSATQNQVNNATATLNNAITTFRDAKEAGEASPVDKSALIAKITEAGIAKNRAAQAESAEVVAQGAPWATLTQHTALANAITIAEAARNTATTQPDVNAATSTLDSAITVFAAAVDSNGVGNKTQGFTAEEVADLIARANAAIEGVVSSVNGYDIPPTGIWVSSSVLNALENAITQAQLGSSDTATAYLALSDALNIFNDAKQPGATPDKWALFTAIGDADKARAGVVIAANQGEALL